MASTVFIERLQIDEVVLVRTGHIAADLGNILAIVQREDGYEITFKNKDIAQHYIRNGLKVNFNLYAVVDALEENLQVTFCHVPYYIDNGVLIRELENAGHRVLGEVRRVKLDAPQTGIRKIENGDRKVTIAGNDPSNLPKSITITAPNGRHDNIRLWWRNQK